MSIYSVCLKIKHIQYIVCKRAGLKRCCIAGLKRCCIAGLKRCCIAGLKRCCIAGLKRYICQVQARISQVQRSLKCCYVAIFIYISIYYIGYIPLI